MPLKIYKTRTLNEYWIENDSKTVEEYLCADGKVAKWQQGAHSGNVYFGTRELAESALRLYSSKQSFEEELDVASRDLLLAYEVKSGDILLDLNRRPVKVRYVLHNSSGGNNTTSFVFVDGKTRMVTVSSDIGVKVRRPKYNEQSSKEK